MAGYLYILLREHATFEPIALGAHGLQVFDLVGPTRMSRHDVVLCHQNEVPLLPTMVQIEMRHLETSRKRWPSQRAPRAICNEAVHWNLGRTLNRILQNPNVPLPTATYALLTAFETLQAGGTGLDPEFTLRSSQHELGPTQTYAWKNLLHSELGNPIHLTSTFYWIRDRPEGAFGTSTCDCTSYTGCQSIPMSQY